MGRMIKGRKATFEVYEDAIFKATICVKGDPKGEETKEDIVMNCPKMPQKLFGQAVGFLHACYNERKSEGMIYFILRQDPFESDKGSWELAVPLQYNSMVRVCAHAEKEPALFADAVGDMHSHPAMDWSGHSGTDDHDEKQHNHGVYAVLSWKGGEIPHVKGDVTIYGYIRGRKIIMHPEHLIDFTTPAPDYAFPREWMDKVFDGWCKICYKEDPVKDMSKEKTRRFKFKPLNESGLFNEENRNNWH